MISVNNHRGFFPPWTNGVLEALQQCIKVRKPGFYCIEFDGSRSEEIRCLINGFFNSFGTFSHYQGLEFIDPRGDGLDSRLKRKKKRSCTIDGTLDPVIEEFISSQTIQYPNGDLQYHCERGEGDTYDITLRRNGQPIPYENPSFVALANSIVAANKALQSMGPLCFMIDVGRLDDSFIEYLYKLFDVIHSRIIEQEKVVFIFFSENQDMNKIFFTSKYLWSESILNNYAKVSDDGCKRLKSYGESVRTVRRCAENIEALGTLSMFIGSGAAYGSGALSTDEMITLALQELLDSDETDLSVLKQLYIEHVARCEERPISLDDISLEGVMSSLRKADIHPSMSIAVKTLKETTARTTLSRGYRILKELASRFRLVVNTTNFDPFIRNAIERRVRVLVTAVEYQEINTSDVLHDNSRDNHLIGKLHGDLDIAPQQIAITIETNDSLPNEKRKFLESCLKGEHLDPQSLYYLIFIGYSFRDKDIRDIIMEKIDGNEYRFIPVIVTPWGDQSVDDFIDKWPKSHSSPPIEVHMSFDRFMEALASNFTEIS